MKVRIKSHSVRFRVDSSDLETLFNSGLVQEVTHVPNAAGETALFTVEVRRGELDEESELRVLPFGLTLLLSTADCAHLAAAETEGIYLRREWTNEAGHQIRFVTYIEKDSKKRKHDRPGDVKDAPKVDLS